VETNRELVAEVLLLIPYRVCRAKVRYSPKTLSTWVRQYQVEVGDLKVKK